ncbi:endonuclease/exonuclease/phosphatase family protein [Halomonas urumqiensis]|uniref:Endonuclease n=1 Tax=Halomonas urumqiensis TaxID=1684789 RepID=A0A2N7UFV3_9GAMM|nr:endonuclease/exonuclease/phosphatase family protein [Halomonas urumqiensis]PMR79337.1 endonuclease [Halomonas urumqiensis]PTB04354.1 endonuclease [Halomonas urumqiensis]
MALCALTLLAITLLAHLRVRWWWIRACEFPRQQIAVLAAVVALVGLFATPPWSWVIVATALLVVIVQVGYILPWTRLWPIQVQPAENGHEGRHLSLLIANVLTPNRESQRLVEIIREQDPDVIITLESDDWWQARLDEAIEADWPHAVKIPLDNLYGMHLYSRRPLIDTEVAWLIQDDIPSIHTGVALASGDVIQLRVLHPRPPAPGESEESLWRDAELLLVGQQIHQAPVPTIVAGDLNDVAWSRTTRRFSRVSGMLDPRRGRGMFSSFHAQYPFLRWPLDHVFTTEHFTLVEMRRLPAFGSDHFPILTRLCYRPSRSDEHETPDADHDEHRIARQTVREGKARTQE